ncbi:MAG TPA: type II toxin-antitoxin system VapC family toxin [Thermoanaerobaculia bacterium]|nr:type II toxin-antitoxin system VapC family toxin [Thermoanaerobaculia bacterium]
MRQFVVDASVAAKWYLPEPQSDHAAALLADPGALLAPDILYVEVAEVVWQRVAWGEVDPATAGEIMAELRKVPFELLSTTELIADALPLALENRCTLRDALYLALAVQANCPLVTADRKLHDTLKTGPRAAHVLWIEDLE